MFGFPKADRELLNKFKKNYLKSVIFQLKFPANKSILDNRKNIIDKFADLFPRSQDIKPQGFEIAFKVDQTPIIQSIPEKQTGYELKSNDGQKVLAITIDTISYTISGNVYSDFENLLSEIKLITEIIDACNIIHITRLAIRKINVIDFIIPDANEGSPMNFLSFVLNQNLLSNVSYFPSTENINQKLHTVNFAKDDSRLNLRYGLLVPIIEKKAGQIIIDIDLFKVGNIDNNKSIDLLREINIEIFNIFNWSLSENAIIQLQQ